MLQEDGASIPTLQKSAATVLVRPRDLGCRPQVRVGSDDYDDFLGMGDKLNIETGRNYHELFRPTWRPTRAPNYVAPTPMPQESDSGPKADPGVEEVNDASAGASGFLGTTFGLVVAIWAFLMFLAFLGYCGHKLWHDEENAHFLPQELQAEEANPFRTRYEVGHPRAGRLRDASSSGRVPRPATLGADPSASRPRRRRGDDVDIRRRRGLSTVGAAAATRLRGLS